MFDLASILKNRKRSYFQGKVDLLIASMLLLIPLSCVSTYLQSATISPAVVLTAGEKITCFDKRNYE